MPMTADDELARVVEWLRREAAENDAGRQRALDAGNARGAADFMAGSIALKCACLRLYAHAHRETNDG